MWTQSVSKEAFLVNFLINVVQCRTNNILFVYYWCYLFIRNLFRRLLSHCWWSISFSWVYNLIRADNPNNIKRGEVCIYYWETSVKIINVNILNECLGFKLYFGSRRVCLVSIYWTPSQSSNAYNTCLLNFEQLLTHLNCINPHMLLVTSDFNVKSSSWWSGDIDTIEGTCFESITSCYGLYQINVFNCKVSTHKWSYLRKSLWTSSIISYLTRKKLSEIVTRIGWMMISKARLSWSITTFIIKSSNIIIIITTNYHYYYYCYYHYFIVIIISFVTIINIIITIFSPLLTTTFLLFLLRDHNENKAFCLFCVFPAI